MKINPFLIATLIFFYVFGYIEEFFVYYFCAFIHEIFHLSTAVFLNIKVEEVLLLPYGVCMKTKFIKSPLHSMIISLSGPFISLILYYFTKDKYAVFSTANLTIFILNIIPVLPLDGGVLLKSLLTYFFGYVKPYKFMIKLTQFFSHFITICGVLLTIITKYNISLLIIGLFLLYNIKYEKINLISLKRKLICDEFCDNKILRINQIAVNEKMLLIDIIDCISYNAILYVNVIDKNKEIVGKVFQKDFFDLCIKYGIYISFGDLIKLKGTDDERI